MSDLKKAKEAVFRLLKVRYRSEHEVRERLKQKGFEAEIVEETIQYFHKIKLLNDQEFARHWISYRLLKPYGQYRIRYELQEKGVDAKIINEELNSAFTDRSEDEIARELLSKRITKYKDMDPQKLKQRMYGYLSRKGFSAPIVRQALKNLA